MQIFRLPKRPIFNFNVLRDDEMKRMILANQQVEMQNQQLRNVVEEQERRQSYFEKIKSIQDARYSGAIEEDSAAQQASQIQQSMYPEEYEKSVLQRLVAMNQYVSAIDVTDKNWGEVLKAELPGYVQYGNIKNLSNIMAEGSKQLALGRSGKGTTAQMEQRNALVEGKLNEFLSTAPFVSVADKAILAGTRDQTYTNTIRKYLPNLSEKDYERMGISSTEAYMFPRKVSTGAEGYKTDIEKLRYTRGETELAQQHGLTPVRVSELSNQMADPKTRQVLKASLDEGISGIIETVKFLPKTNELLFWGGNLNVGELVKIWTDPNRIDDKTKIINELKNQKLLEVIIMKRLALELGDQEMWLEWHRKAESQARTPEFGSLNIIGNTPATVNSDPDEAYKRKSR